ncbi:MAG TPA: CBS domain-containing protein [Allosphingosinicella sp.]|jgi:CBS domain-containing protein
MNIEAILRTKGGEVVTVACDTPVREAVALLAERRIGALPVMKDERVVGIMSERDVIYCLKKDGAAVLDLAVEKVMTAPIIAAEPNMPVLAGLSLMTERRIRHLPVVEGGNLVGLVSIGDLVKFRMDRIEEEAAALRDYIQTA